MASQLVTAKTPLKRTLKTKPKIKQHTKPKASVARAVVVETQPTTPKPLAVRVPVVKAKQHLLLKLPVAKAPVVRAKALTQKLPAVKVPAVAKLPKKAKLKPLAVKALAAVTNN